MSRPIWPLPGKARQLAIYTTRCVKMPVFIALQADGKVSVAHGAAGLKQSRKNPSSLSATGTSQPSCLESRNSLSEAMFELAVPIMNM